MKAEVIYQGNEARRFYQTDGTFHTKYLITIFQVKIYCIVWKNRLDLRNQHIRMMCMFNISFENFYHNEPVKVIQKISIHCIYWQPVSLLKYMAIRFMLKDA